VPVGRKFGQNEPLTTRLHNLVRSYPKGLGVLKEFIQNADDAEADEIVFVIDEQEYDTAGLPDTMEWLHTSPALLVYNSKPFSDSDLEGIQRIGESGKSESVGKTGRFGLGFNACYNVTDVPCFFTRGFLHFFDPHFHTVPDASVESPGRCFGADELILEGWPLLDSLEQFTGDGSDFKGVVFRLPFRSPGQARSSRIKKDAYTLDDARQSVRELQDMGSAMLLFLKHVRRVGVQWRDRDGTVADVLSIEARNPAEIAESRVEVNALLSISEPEELLETLSRVGDVFSSCRQEYRVNTQEAERDEIWRVVDGFFIDERLEILGTCRKMFENEEKALPYAGAAYPLGTHKQIKGRVFCSLPTPMPTALPIQLNGYFDLEDSRQSMFLDAATQGSARVRYEWNRDLLGTSAARAYVRLLMELRADFTDESAPAYYRVFPKFVNENSGWEGWLTGALYQGAAEMPTIRVADDEKWKSLADTRSLPDELLSVQEALVSEKKLPIPLPPIPSHVHHGFTANEIEVPELTPHDLRTELKVESDVDCLIGSAHRHCLRSRDHVVQLLRFCLSDDPEEDIRGLPLAIDFREHLRTIGLTSSPLYLAHSELDFDVFAEHPDWFVDPCLVADVGLKDAPDTNLLAMDAERFVDELGAYVAAITEDDSPQLGRAKSGPLTDEWLRSVFSRLLDSDLSGLKSDLNEIPLVPDQSRILRTMGNSATPLLFKGAQDLKHALTALSVPLVLGVSPELFALLQLFSEKEDCIWLVTPRDLVDTLADECSEALADYDDVSDIQRAILTYLSREESVAALSELADRRDKLKRLKLFPTSDGKLVNLAGDTYTSQGFRFPAVDLDVTLLDAGPNQRWRGLYRVLDVPELSRSRLIRQVLLPGFVDMDQDALIESSTWLRDELSRAQSEDEAAGVSSRLFDEVRESPIVVCEDGELRAPRKVYQPGSKLAEAVLRDQAVFPDMQRTYAKSHSRWLEFFRQLDMPTEPQLGDVVAYVKNLAEREPSEDNAARLQAAYHEIKRRVDAALDDGNELPNDLEEAVDDLAETAWVPLRQEAGDLLCFQPPEQAYARPQNVFFPRVGQLVASQAGVTTLRPEPSKRCRKVLGFPVKPPVEFVVGHFERVLDACADAEYKPRATLLVRALGQIYRFFGGEAPQEADDLDEVAGAPEAATVPDLAARFSDTPCIWDQDRNQFWRPGHVFSDNVRYMEPWRKTIRAGEAAIERGYAALGRLESPTIEDWKMVLEEIADSGKCPSNYEVAGVIREVVRRTTEELERSGDMDDEVLVPTRNGEMRPAGTVFLADAPWFEPMLDSWNIPLLAPRLESVWGIERTLGISSLEASVEQRLTEFPIESDLKQESDECSRLQRLLRSDEFNIGLRRLLRHDGQDVTDASLRHLPDIHVICVKAIRTSLFLRVDDSDQLLGDSEAEIYWDHETLQAMLAERRLRYFCDDLAGLLSRALGMQTLRHSAPLVHMLNCEPTEIADVLDDLKIRQYAFETYTDESKQEDVTTQEFPNDGVSDDSDMHAGEDASPGVTDAEPEDQEYEIDEFHEEAAVDRTDTESSPTDQPAPCVTSTASPRRGSGDRDDASSLAPADGDRSSAGGGGTWSMQGQTSGKRMAAHVDQEASQAPRAPHRETASRRRQQTQQRRLVSYVARSNTDDRDAETAPSDDRRLRIADAAVQIVLQHEHLKGFKARSMAHANAGYDILSERDGATRYIEVKGTEAAWGERGVALTPTQFFYGRENEDRDHWLYVVEDVFSQTPRIHEIRDPSTLVDRFIFDGGWRDAADTATATGVSLAIPSPGDKVLRDGVFAGTVESTLEAGRFPLVIYRDSDGNQQRKRLADIVIQPKES
jgi:sacsin